MDLMIIKAYVDSYKSKTFHKEINKRKAWKEGKS
ncbi:hypothetical protein LINPERHAP1_LOCUS27693 [Linum perenne]